MLAMHMQQALHPCPFVQIIHILRHQQQIARPCRIQPRERIMRGIWFHLLNMFAAHIVKAQYKVGVTRKGLRCSHIFYLMLLPKAPCAAKGINPALGTDASAR